MIDLHTHTTESDGRCRPAELVARASRGGVHVLAVTDHDTVSACETTAAECSACGIEFVPGIEITAVREGGDVHLLGYFIDITSPGLHAFLTAQRAARVDRVRQIVARLGALGLPLDEADILGPAISDPRKSAGRPWVARALVSAGHVSNVTEAFDRWLGYGKPAYVPRAGASPPDVIARIHDAGGLASLAHPGLIRHDEWIAGFVADGLDALEAYHSEHDNPTTSHYIRMAESLGVAVSGGSDFHGDSEHGPADPGAVSLPEDAYRRLLARRRGRP